MTPEEMLDEDIDLPLEGEAEEWDEETLGLDWNESELDSITREISSLK